MKPKYAALIIIFHTFLALNLCAQSWMSDSLAWKETREINQGLTVTRNYTTVAQEVINDTLYQRIHRTSCTSPDTGSFVCHLREEENQVFARVNGLEYLLYDFNLEVGDGFSPTICVDDYYVQIIDLDIGPFEVSQVSTMDINGEARRVISFDNSAPFDFTWIEGIGSNKGLFNGTEACGWVDYVSVLTCFERNNITEYDYPFYDECCVNTLSALNSSGPRQESLIFPNPISGSERLHFSSRINDGLINIYSLEGRLVFSRNFSGDFSATPTDMGLSSGLFVVEIEGKASRHFQKLLVR